LAGFAFVLGLFFAGLLKLPQTSLAQGTVGRLTGSQTAVKPVAAPEIPAARPLVELSDAFSAVAEHVRPSVVFIKSERKQTAARTPVPRGFEDFFNLPQRRQPMIQRGSGSGFVVTDNGYILTNSHVVDGAEKVTVQLLDRRTFPARVIGADPLTDVAVIKIEARGLTPAALGSSAATKIGEWVLAVGNPLGENLTFTVTSGIVSAKGRGQLNLPGRDPQGRSIQDFIQTDAAINPGNSGGPLVNVRAEVIGINSAIASETGFSQGYGFAIPIDLAKTVMDQLIKNGKVERAQLGVYIEDVTPKDAEYVGLDEVRGVLISRFSDGESPARRAGLEPGDIIIAIDGQDVNYVSQLQQVVGFKRPGETVKLLVARKGGERKTVDVRLVAQAAVGQEQLAAGERPDNPGERSDENASTSSIRPLGISVSPLTSVQAEQLGVPGTVRGLVVREVEQDGPSAEDLIGASSGNVPDVIVSVEGVPVRTEAELRTALRRAGPGGIVTLIVYNAQFRAQRVERIKLVQ
jgi:serine protease Do